MCFDNSDYDWFAQVVTDEVSKAEKPERCQECRREIAQGEYVRSIFMQEHDQCVYDPTSDDYDGPETEKEGCPDDCDHDYGETFECSICETCDQLLKAIKQHELDERCDESESQPAFGELGEAMVNGDGSGYLAKAEAMFPGITERLPKNWVKVEVE